MDQASLAANPSIPMKITRAFVTLLVIVLFQSLIPLAKGDPTQPRMENAIEQLEAAKTAERPLPDLEAARKALKNARQNKDGQRLDALGFVNEAIEYAKAGDKEKMLERINKAIANAKSGMARTR
jgi:tetratricopeptide (TPR) repeat protein